MKLLQEKEEERAKLIEMRKNKGNLEGYNTGDGKTRTSRKSSKTVILN